MTLPPAQVEALQREGAALVTFRSELSEFERGKRDGYNKGYDEGHRDGYGEGHTDGYREGLQS